MSEKFVHLHTHSHYSLLNALPKLDALVEETKKNGMSALALTDNCNLYGAIEFYQQCTKVGIKPIIGIDAYVAYRSRFDKQAGVDKERYRLVLLAKNETGYKNLIKLVTVAHLEGFYYRPRLDKEVLEKYKDGLIAIAPATTSDIASSLSISYIDQARERLAWYKKIFEKDFYLGLDRDSKKMLEFARENKISVAAAPDVFYLYPEDRIARETLLSIQSQTDEKVNEGTEDFSFMTPGQAEKVFADAPDALENTLKIAEECNLHFTLGKWILPNYIVESGLSHDDELRRVTYEGLKEHGLEETPEIKKRIEYELQIIKDKGFAPYFLVVSDLLHFARKNKIVTTTRGSAGGSLVSFLNFITTVNPLEFKLPFERFLNPERPKAPDIDMDIADNRRDELIEYAKKKHGTDRVVQIGTFGTMAARGAVRDVTRALGFPYGLGDVVAKLIPFGAQGFPMTIDRALEESPELKKMYGSENDVKKIIDMARKIEGCARHISVHAAGVVIAPKPVTEFAPIQFDPKGEGKVITQYDMYAITDEYGGVGLLKFDFLGIRNLAILADSIKLAEKIEGVNIDLDTLPLDDRKTFDMLARGETIGLFQLNGDGMTRWLKELKPTTIHDINAMVALYRPGPMETIPQYIERKHNPKLIKYLDPRMKEYLEFSNGVLVYQDDVLLTAIKLAGYSWLEADSLRKAMGKKIPEVMMAEEEKLIAGMIKNNVKENIARQIWELIKPFAAYGFGKAHAASYGRVAYQTAYMKANFPAIYMSAVLTAESGNIDMIYEIITECKRMGTPILPPDINESFEGFTVVKSQKDNTADSIRFGLNTIKNFGEGIAASIIAERKKSGTFNSLSDFLCRVKDKNLNKKSLESLIKSGALDSFAPGNHQYRNLLLHNLDRLLEFHKEEQKMDSGPALFETSEIHLEPAPEINTANRLLWEKELLGLYISGHPLDSFRDKFEKKELNIKKVKESGKERQEVILGGIIEEARPISTKDGSRMAFLKFADLSDSIEAVAFPKVFEEFQEILIPESCIVIKGTVSTRNDVKSILIDKVRLME